MFIDLVHQTSNCQYTVYSDIKKHGLPVVIYGAGELSFAVRKKLEKNGIDVFGHAVDSPYYENGKTLGGKGIFDFDKLKGQ